MTERASNTPPLKRRAFYPCEAEIAQRLLQSEKHWQGYIQNT
jgi:hypothetical protein